MHRTGKNCTGRADYADVGDRGGDRRGRSRPSRVGRKAAEEPYFTATGRAWGLMHKDGTMGAVEDTRADARRRQQSYPADTTVVKVQPVKWRGRPLHSDRGLVKRVSDLQRGPVFVVDTGDRMVNVMITEITPIFGWSAKQARYVGVLWPFGWW